MSHYVRLSRVIQIVFMLFICAAGARAETLYWDPDGSNTGNDYALGTNLGGGGNWEAASAWVNSSGVRTTWNNANNDDAVFFGTGTVTLGSAITAKSLAFNGTAYTLNGSVLTFSSTGTGIIDVAPAATATFNSVLAGTVGIAKNNTGTLILAAPNTYTGTTFVNAGTLRLGTAPFIPPASGGAAPAPVASWIADNVAGADGSSVGTWTDSIGGKNASQYTHGAAGAPNPFPGPTLNANPATMINGHKTLRFTTNQVLRVAPTDSPLATAGDFTVAVVFRPAAIGVGAAGTQWYQNTGLVDCEQSGGATDWGLGWNAVGQVAAGMGNADRTLNSAGTTLNYPHVAIYTRQGASMTLNVDGTLTTRTDAATTARSPYQVLFGACNTGVPPGSDNAINFFNGEVAEIHMYTTAVLGQNMTDLFNTLSTKYAPAPIAMSRQWKADDIAGADGSSVTTWTDAVAARNAVQYGANAVPTLNASTLLNGHKTVRFNGANQVLDVLAADSPISGAADYTIAVVFKPNTAGVGGAGQWYQNTGLVDSEQPGGTNDWGLAWTGTSQVGAGLGAGDTTLYSLGSSPLPLTIPHVAIYSRRLNQITLSMDGAISQVNAGGGTAARNSNHFLIGAINAGAAAGNFFNGEIAEIQMYNTAVLGQQLIDLYDSLANKYFPGPAMRWTGDSVAGADGSNVATWTDLIRSKNATLLGANAPTLNASNLMNGHKTVRFAGNALQQAFQVASVDSAMASVGDFTIACVFKPAASGAGTNAGNWFSNSGLVDMEQGGVTNDWGLVWTGANSAGAGIGGGADRTSYSAAGALNIPHIAIYSRQGSSITLNFDGFVTSRLDGSAAARNFNAAAPGTRFFIGNCGGQAANYFNGEIAEIAIYRQALLRSNMTALYNSLASTYSPAPTLARQWTADSIPGVDGTPVATWTDSVATKNATAFGAAPTLNAANLLNGHKTVKFNGTTQALQVLAADSPIAGANNFTLAVVFRPAAAGVGGGTNGVNQWTQNSGLVDGDTAGTSNDWGLNWTSGRQIGAGLGNPDTTLYSGATALNSAHVAIYSRIGGNIFLSLDGALSTLSTGPATARGAFPFLIGTSSTSNYFNGEIAEIRMYSGALTGQALTDLNATLSGNYLVIPTPNTQWVADSIAGADLSSVTTWTDSIAARNATTFNSAPLLNANPATLLNGHKSVRFNGLNQALQVAAVDSTISGAGDFTVAVVFKPIASGVTGVAQWYNNSGVIDAEQGGATNDWGTGWSSTNQFAAGLGLGDITTYSAPLTLNAVHTAVYSRQGGTITLNVDGNITSATGGGTAVRNSNRFLIGSLNGAGAQYFNGEVAELQMFNSAVLGTSQAALVYTLSTKYGVVVASNIIPDNSTVVVAGGAIFDLNSITETVGALSGGGSVTLGNATLTAGANGSSTVFGGVISGNGRFTKSGVGTLQLAGANTYGGDTAVNGGTVLCGIASAIPSGAGKGNLSIGSGAFFDINSFDVGVNGLSGTGSVTKSAANASSLTIGNNNATSTFTGILQNGAGTLRVTKTGTGTLTLASAGSTFSGDFSITQGTVAATAASAGGGAIARPSSALGNLSVARNIIVSAAATLNFSASNVMGDTTNLPAVAALSITGGTVTNNGVTFNKLGPVTFSGGSLIATGGANALTQAYQLAGIVTVGGSSAAAITASGANSGIHLAANTTINIADTVVGADLTVTANLIDQPNSAGAGGFTKTGAGTLSIISTGSTFSGATNINVGTVLISDPPSSPPVIHTQWTGDSVVGADNSPVSPWTDVLLSRNATLISATAPTLNASSLLNGHKTVRFNGSQNLQVAAADSSISGQGDFTVAVVFRPAAPGSVLAPNSNWYNYSGLIDAEEPFVVNDWGTSWSDQNQFVAGLGNPDGSMYSAPLALNAPHVAVFTRQGGNLTMSVDGVITTRTGMGAAIRNNARFFIGATFQGSFYTYFTGEIAEIQLYRSAMIGSNMDTVVASLATKYAIPVTPPSGIVSNAIGDNSAVTIAGGAVLDVNSHNETIGSLTGAGNVTLGSGTLVTGGNNTSTSYDGVASGAGGITKAGTGTFTLNNAGNSYSGTTTVNAGTLRYGAVTAVPSGVGKGNVSIASAGSLDINGLAVTVNGLSGTGTVLSSVAGPVTFTAGANNATSTWTGVITNGTGTVSFAKTGTGTLSLANGNTYSGTTTVNGGTLRISSAAGAVPPSPQTAWVADTLAGVEGTAVATWTDSVLGRNATTFAGTPTLNVAAPINGHKSVRFNGASGMQVAAADSTIAGANNFTIAVVFKPAASGVTGVAQWYNNSGLIDGEEGGVTNDWGTAWSSTNQFAAGLGNPDVTTYSAPLALNAPHVAVYARSGGTLTMNVDGTVSSIATGGAAARNFTRFVIASLNGIGGQFYNGEIAEFQLFNTAITGTAMTDLVNSLGLKYAIAGFGNGQPPIPAASPVTVAGGATLDLNNFNTSIGSLAGAGNVALGSATMTVGALNTNTTFSGSISGTGGVAKTGTAGFTLSGSNSFSGAAAINQGTLAVNGSICAGAALTVNNGGTLAGTGSVNRAINAVSGGTVAPGNSGIGILNAGNATFAPGATLAIEVNGPISNGTPAAGTDHDQLNVTGTVAPGNGTLAISGTYIPVNGLGQTYVIVKNDVADAVTGTFSGLPNQALTAINGTTSRIYYNFNSDGNPNDIAVVANHTPVAAVTSPDYFVNEGSLVQLNGTPSTDADNDTLTYDWDFNDGAGFQINIGPTPNFSAVNKDDSIFIVTLRVSDGRGQSSTVTTNVHIQNVPPVMSSVIFTTTIDEHGTVTITGNITDPGSLDTFVLTVDWNEGAPEPFFLPAGTTSFNVSHQYLDDNPIATTTDIYNLGVTLVDDNQGAAPPSSATSALTVNNVAPQLTNLAIVSIDEDGTTTLSGTIVDPGTQDTFTLNINWGDPLSPNDSEVYLFAAANGSQNFVLTHQYLDDNPTNTPSDDYTVSLNLTDDDTGAANSNMVITVANIIPVLVNLEVSAVVENDVASLTGTLTDIGTLDTVWLDIDWGDPFSPSMESIPFTSTFNGTTFAIPHQYLNNPLGGNSFLITVTPRDDDVGIAATQSLIVTVDNVAPSNIAFVFAPSDILNEGQQFSLSATFDDPGTLDTHVVTVQWGDGTPDIVLNLNPSVLSFGPLDHIYADNQDGLHPGFYTITVSIDDGDVVTTVQHLMTVHDVEPDIALSGQFSYNSLMPYFVTFGAITDPGADTVTQYIIHWGDGATESFSMPFPTTVSHSYAANIDSPLIIVDLLDEDGLHLNCGQLQPPGFGSDTIVVTAQVGESFFFDFVGDGGMTGTPQPVITVGNVELPPGLSSIADVGLILGPSTLSSASLLRAGELTITFIATNAGGAKAVNLVIRIKRSSGGSNTPQINSAPVATPNPAQVGVVVNFSASATDADGDLLSYWWDFGDGTDDGNANRKLHTSHIYSAPGTYACTLVVEDDKHSTFKHFTVVIVDAATISNYRIQTFKLTLDFRTPARSQLVIVGSVPIPSNQPQVGTIANVQIPGSLCSQDFQLNSKFTGGDAFSLFSLKVTAPGVTQNIAKFTLHLKGVDASGVSLYDKLSPLGYTNELIGKPGRPVTLPLVIRVPNTLAGEQSDIKTVYVTVKGKTGKAVLAK